jgi:protein ImuB
LARGDDPRRPGLVRVEAVRQASIELPAAVEQTAPILFVLRAQLQRLVQECVHDGRAAAAVAITLVLDAGRQYPLEEIDGHDPSSAEPEMAEQRPRLETSANALLGIPQRSITREVRPARPLARLEPLFDQCRALLERWRIPAPIIGVTVSIPATAPLAADQGDLLIPSWRDAAMNAEAVFARLRAVLDPDQRGDVVVHAEAQDSHRPEETGRWAAADAVVLASAPLPVAASVASAATASAAVLRLLGTPEPVEVEAPDARPDAVWWRGRRLALVAAHGPERLSGDWWRGDGYARDYWRCLADPDGELLLFHAEQQWYLQGWYD